MTKAMGAALALTLALLAIAAAVAPALGVGLNSPFALPTATPPAFRPAASGTAVPQGALVPHSNPALGYSLSLPPSYRLAVSNADTQNTGQDFYSPRGAQKDSQLCAQEKTSSLQSPERVADIRVIVSANPSGASPFDFVSTPNRRLPFTSIESTTINGFTAARIVHQPSTDTAYYVVAANSRLYEIAPFILEQPTTQPRGWLDQIAASFKASSFQAVSLAAPHRYLCAP